MFTVDPNADYSLELLSLLSLEPAAIDDLCIDLDCTRTEIANLIDELHERGYAVVARKPNYPNPPITTVYLSMRGVDKAKCDAEAYVDERETAHAMN